MAIQTESLEELLHKDPFRPFRIFTAGGKEYPVNDPALVIVMRGDLFYAYPARDRWSIIPISAITSVEVEKAA